MGTYRCEELRTEPTLKLFPNCLLLGPAVCPDLEQEASFGDYFAYEVCSVEVVSPCC